MLAIEAECSRLDFVPAFIFGALLDDIAKTGRPPIEDGKEHDFIGGFGLFEVLHFVSNRNKEARSELAIYQTLVEAIDDIRPPRQS